jgi:hypothetical protein
LLLDDVHIRVTLCGLAVWKPAAIQIDEGLGVLHCVMNHVVSSLRVGFELLQRTMSAISDTTPYMSKYSECSPPQ